MSSAYLQTPTCAYNYKMDKPQVSGTCLESNDDKHHFDISGRCFCGVTSLQIWEANEIAQKGWEQYVKERAEREQEYNDFIKEQEKENEKYSPDDPEYWTRL